MAATSSTTIHLLPQEELSSTLERLAEASADHITLVLPEKSVASQGLIALQILADEAKRLKKTVTISSDSAQIRRMSKRVGLEVAGDGESIPEHGFVAGADVAKLHPDQPTEEEAPIAPVPTEPAATALVATKAASSPSFWDKLVTHLRGHGWKWITGVAVVILLLGAGLVYVLDYYLPEATVTLFAEKQSIDRDVTLVADPNATTVNEKTLTIPATAVSATVSKTETFEASGSKDVGTKGGGTITIFNKSNSDKSFNAGTVIASDGKQFLLDSTVTVEAATVETSMDPITLETTTKSSPGTASVEVTAADIGSEYNLDAKSTFTIAKFDSSTYSARNEEAFTGGSKKTVKIVTADDLTKALDSVESALEDEAEASLKTKVPKGQELLKGAVEQEVSTKQYSQAAGDQADSFSLTLEITSKGLAVSQDDIKSLLNTEVATKVPEGYELDAENSAIDTNVLSTDNDGSVQLTATYRAPVIPVVDADELRKAIAGKQPSAVEDYLKHQPNLNGYDIVISPKLPGPFYHLPKMESKIKVEVEVQ